MQPKETKNGKYERAINIHRGQSETVQHRLNWSSEGGKREDKAEAVIKGIKNYRFSRIDRCKNFNKSQALYIIFNLHIDTS